MGRPFADECHVDRSIITRDKRCTSLRLSGLVWRCQSTCADMVSVVPDPSVGPAVEPCGELILGNCRIECRTGFQRIFIIPARTRLYRRENLPGRIGAFRRCAWAGSRMVGWSVANDRTIKSGISTCWCERRGSRSATCSRVELSIRHWASSSGFSRKCNRRRHMSGPWTASS